MEKWSTDKKSLGPSYVAQKYFAIKKKKVVFAKVTANTILISTAN